MLFLKKLFVVRNGVQSSINLNGISRVKFSLEGVLIKSGSAAKSNVSVNLIATKYSSFRSKHLYFRQIQRLFADITKGAKKEHSLYRTAQYSFHARDESYPF